MSVEENYYRESGEEVLGETASSLQCCYISCLKTVGRLIQLQFRQSCIDNVLLPRGSE